MGLCLIFHVGSPDGKFQCSLPLILVYIYIYAVSVSKKIYAVSEVVFNNNK